MGNACYPKRSRESTDLSLSTTHRFTNPVAVVSVPFELEGWKEDQPSLETSSSEREKRSFEGRRVPSRRPRVLRGCIRENGELREVNKAMEAAMEGLGWPPEAQGAMQHLVREKMALQEACQRLQDRIDEAWHEGYDLGLTDGLAAQSHRGEAGQARCRLPSPPRSPPSKGDPKFDERSFLDYFQGVERDLMQREQQESNRDGLKRAKSAARLGRSKESGEVEEPAHEGMATTPRGGCNGDGNDTEAATEITMYSEAPDPEDAAEDAPEDAEEEPEADLNRVVDL